MWVSFTLLMTENRISNNKIKVSVFSVILANTEQVTLI
ncbi:hypothetical protein GPAL_0334 [Glaciecola pallidula DSM 14239 = ACAM 615]|uniref:Uncharacterized protein n=1 Tax=Brumicola pallidula DSM 14239 = ACAM 615 TaxID=1121922 RepID=K6Y326_9ALTE|nr:hypothetical protein GPAL_0334 [Glaciecola pallidula DSM 14239 = ACAM 615]